MTAKSNLDLKGIIRAYPVAETVLEISQAGLTGSLRVEMNDQKAVIYFVEGCPAYAVSNEKRFRLFKILIEKGLIDSDYLAQNLSATNDLQLAEKIENDSKLSASELEAIISAQCEAVLNAIVTWSEGEWTFSPHARLRSGVRYNINIANILLAYARSTSPEIAARNLANVNEWFSRRQIACSGPELSSAESFILSRFDTTDITLSQALAVIGEAACNVEKNIYHLWLGGYLSRKGWQQAFTEERISYLRSADLELKKPAKSRVSLPIPATPEKPVDDSEPGPPDIEPQFDLNENLARIEAAQTSYEVLGLTPAAKAEEIRKAYYRLAKMLHPDRYRRDGEDLLRRVEKVFTELAQAHESIKTPEARHNYDLRMRQAEIEKKTSDDETAEGGRQGHQAAGDFERGFALQLEGEFEAALPFLARAAYYEPRNARYRAYYGKALSVDDDQRHKAEKELATAVQMEPGNVTYRIMLAEFFIKHRLIKRAEGELKRLLEMSPGNQDALRLLDRLRGN